MKADEWLRLIEAHYGIGAGPEEVRAAIMAAAPPHDE